MEVVFGGSFNPPTKAHLEIIRYLVRRFGRVTIVPNGNSYHYYRKNLIDFHHRAEMVRLLTKDLEPQVTISDYEMSHPDFQGSYEMLKDLGHPLFAIGADSLSAIRTWIRYEDLVRENRFLVFPRSDIDIMEMLDKDPFLNKYHDHFMIADDFPPLTVSSSAYRKNKEEQNLSVEIIDYIKKNKLYGVN